MCGGVRLRIAVVSPYPPTHCGVAEYTRFLVAALRSVAPRKVQVLVLGNEVVEEGQDPYTGATVYRTFTYARPETFVKVLEKLSEIGGVDVLHLQHEYGIFGCSEELLQLLREVVEERLAKVLVTTLHTVYTTLHSGRPEVRFQVELSQVVDAIVVHSMHQEFELYSQGLRSETLHRIPHGTLINPYLAYPRSTLAEKLGIPLEKLRGLIVAVPGFLRKDKGLDVLLSAVSQCPDLKATIIVAGEVREPEVRTLVEEARSLGKLLFLEKYLTNEELLSLVALSDVIVLPYRDKPGTYSVSGILHISMGSLKPIVGSRIPRLMELYQHAPRLTFRPECVEHLVRKLRWIVKNYDYAIAYASSLYSYAVRTQWLRMARRHLNLYRYVLERRKT